MVSFRYFFYHNKRPVVAADPQWRAPLPANRFGSTPPGTGPISYGDYFRAVHDFLAADNGSGLIRALSKKLGRVLTLEDIGRIEIITQKHGAFYHPARVNIITSSQPISFVVNVALSPEGQAGLHQEFDLLNRLSDSFSRCYVPAVYHLGIGGTGESGRRFPMFLGEWLSGYHEFHIHLPDDHPPTIKIWDPAEQITLGAKQTTLLYHRAAEILTYYYNLETFEQIFPWHHGAGDFVVRLSDDEPDLRLITVRAYSSLVEADGVDVITIFDALLRFFLHLSLRTRIDRVDGTGDLIWANELSVKGTVSGFFDGLADKRRVNEMTASPANLMGAYLLHLSPAELAEDLAGIVRMYPPQSPERRLMALHQTDHAKTLFDDFRKYLLSYHK